MRRSRAFLSEPSGGTGWRSWPTQLWDGAGDCGHCRCRASRSPLRRSRSFPRSSSRFRGCGAQCGALALVVLDRLRGPEVAARFPRVFRSRPPHPPSATAVSSHEKQRRRVAVRTVLDIALLVGHPLGQSHEHGCRESAIYRAHTDRHRGLHAHAATCAGVSSHSRRPARCHGLTAPASAPMTA